MCPSLANSTPNYQAKVKDRERHRHITYLNGKLQFVQCIIEKEANTNEVTFIKVNDRCKSTNINESISRIQEVILTNIRVSVNLIVAIIQLLNMLS